MDVKREVKLILTKGLAKDLKNRYSILHGTKYFAVDGRRNFLVFHLYFKYFQTFTGTDKIFGRKSKGLSEKSIKTPAASDKQLCSKIEFYS